VRQPSADEVLAVLAQAFDGQLALWLREGFAPIRQAWLDRAGGMGGPCTARLDKESISGIAESLDADGALLLRLPGGELRRITAGDVFFGQA
jgi:BirA family biotin operon repressor/biotin-[acetyl-CoA-carboxylase] ligase